MRLGIDLDGVVCDFNAGLVELHRVEIGNDLDPADVSTWARVYELVGFDDLESFFAWAQPNGSRRSLYYQLRPFTDALSSLAELAADGHELVVITHRPDWARTDTLRWLADVEYPTGEVYITDAKYRVACDVYLDDSPVVLPELVQHRPDATVCRFVRPWNEPVAGAVDVSSWAEFQRLVRGLAHRPRRGRW